MTEKPTEDFKPGQFRVREIGEITTRNGDTVNGAIIEFPAGPPPELTLGDIWNGTAFQVCASPVPPAEPVGWQKRYSLSNGDWTPWMAMDRALFEFYVSTWGGLSFGSGVDAVEIRPLYAHPSPGSVAGVKIGRSSDVRDQIIASTFDALEGGWQTIETAPKDGTEIIVYAPGREGVPEMVSLCAWHPDAGFCIDELRTPTLWQPRPGSVLPPSPARDETKHTPPDSLIETIARAIAARDGHAFDGPDDGYYIPLARAALAAIEQQGWAVVPKAPTEAMLGAGDYERECEGGSTGAIYAALLSARPTVTT